MTTIAIYLFFVSALSGYRSSRYWPKESSAGLFLRTKWWVIGAFLPGLILLISDMGWTSGILSTIGIYMIILSGLIFFVAGNRGLRIGVLVFFHLVCLMGLIFKF